MFCFFLSNLAFNTILQNQSRTESWTAKICPIHLFSLCVVNAHTNIKFIRTLIGKKNEQTGEISWGTVVCYRNASDADIGQAKVVKEVIAKVREHVGPVASFKDVIIVPRLPKTRSGKIARNTLAAIAAGQPYKVSAQLCSRSAALRSFPLWLLLIIIQMISFHYSFINRKVSLSSELWFSFYSASYLWPQSCDGVLYSVSQKSSPPPKTFCNIFYLG